MKNNKVFSFLLTVTMLISTLPITAMKKGNAFKVTAEELTKGRKSLTSVNKSKKKATPTKKKTTKNHSTNTKTDPKDSKVKRQKVKRKTNNISEILKTLERSTTTNKLKTTKDNEKKVKTNTTNKPKVSTTNNKKDKPKSKKFDLSKIGQWFSERSQPEKIAVGTTSVIGGFLCLWGAFKTVKTIFKITPKILKAVVTVGSPIITYLGIKSYIKPKKEETPWMQELKSDFSESCSFIKKMFQNAFSGLKDLFRK